MNYINLLKHKLSKGIKAVIVYPMNALINSQLEEITKHKKNFEEETGKEFPIANEAFKKMPDDDNQIRGELAKYNKKEREGAEYKENLYQYTLKESVDHVSELFKKFSSLPETTIEEIEQKRKAYQKMTTGQNW